MQFERYDPRKYLSRTVQDTFEGGPANEAMFNGEAIQMTYGDLATRLVEHEIFDADLDAICRHLQINRKDWASASAHMAVMTRADAEDFISSLAFSLNVNEYNSAEEGQRNAYYAMEGLMSQWATNEDPTPFAEDMHQKQSEMRSLSSKAWENSNGNNQDKTLLLELAEAEAEYHIAGMRVRAVRSGTCVALTTFAQAVIAIDYETNVLGGSAVRGIQNLLDDIIERINDPDDEPATDIKASDIFIGKQEINAFQNYVQGTFSRKVRAAKNLTQKRLYPVFYPPSYETLPLFQPPSPASVE